MEQLSLLASQHHTSQYNRSKFGPNGCPIPYLPLSLHLPEQFYQLRQQQSLNSQRPAWWPSPSHLPPVTHLQDDIMAAMSEPLWTPNIPSIKTSISHPINISMIIPPDLVALISSHALLSSSPDAPTLLEIPPSFCLARLSHLRDAKFHQLQYPTLVIQPPSLISTAASHLPTRSHVSDALQAAISTGIDKDHGKPPEHIISGFIPESNLSLSVSMKLPGPMSLTMPLPPASHFHSFQQIGFSRPTQPPCFLPTLWSSEITHPSAPVSAEPPFVIGNLLLSSCPGKKVRLDGPVKGRNGVCRDVETDMKRMKTLGVGCIVCCLDDSELEFLGAPWPEYERSAQKSGIDILRLPIPEGLPPLSPAYLDTHLVELIHRYSLRGIPVLVHCRGGVGRAGVIACCWMIRLGLCGSAYQNSEFPSPRGRSENPDRDILSFVETVITLIRRRRSMKAIETYEQVQFLVDYVEYLWNGPRTPQDISAST